MTSEMTLLKPSNGLTKSEIHRSERLIRRWVWISRGGLPDLGYGSVLLSPQTSGTFVIHSIDVLAASVMNGLALPLRSIAKLRYDLDLSIKQISERENMTPKMVRNRLEFIHKEIIRHCFIRLS